MPGEGGWTRDLILRPTPSVTPRRRDRRSSMIEHRTVAAGPSHRDGVELKVPEVLDDSVAAFPRPSVARARAIGEAEAAWRKQAGTGKSEPPCLQDADGLGREDHLNTYEG